MRYMFERKMQRMAGAGGVKQAGGGGGSGSGAAAGVTSGAEKEKKSTEPEAITHPEGEIETSAAPTVESGSSVFVPPGITLSEIEKKGKRDPQGRGDFLDVLAESERTVAQELQARQKTGVPVDTFDETKAKEWKLGSEIVTIQGRDGPQAIPVPTIKGSGMDGVVAYDANTQRFSETKNDEKAKTKKLRALEDKDVLGYIRGNFEGFDEMSGEQQKLFWEHIQANGGTDSLSRLNFVEGKRMEQLQSSGTGRDRYGRGQPQEGVLGGDHSYFDPTNPDNRVDFFRKRLGEMSGSLNSDDRKKAEEAFAGRPPAEQKKIMQMDTRDALRELEVQTQAATHPEQLESLRNKDLEPAGKEKVEPVEHELREQETDLSEKAKSNSVKQQTEQALRLREAREWDSRVADLDNPEKKDDPEVATLRSLLDNAGAIGGDGKKMYFDGVKYVEQLGEIGEKIPEGHKQIWDDYCAAVSDGDLNEIQKKASELGAALSDATDKESIAALTASIATDSYFSEAEKTSRTEKQVILDQLKDKGVPPSVLAQFREGTFNGETGALKQSAKESVASEEAAYQALENETHYERDLRKYARDKEAFKKMTEALYNGEPAKATRLAQEITGDNKLKFDRGDYTDEGLKRVTERRKAQRESQQAEVNDGFKSVADVLDKPGKVLELASSFIGSAKTGIEAINSIGEALNLKLDTEEARALREGVKFDTLFGATGAGKRGFGRDIFGKEGNFAKYDKKEPAEGSAAKNLAGMATVEKSGRARRQDIENKDALNTKSNAEAVKLASEGMATEEKESASAGKKRRYKVHTNYGGPGIPV